MQAMLDESVLAMLDLLHYKENWSDEHVKDRWLSTFLWAVQNPDTQDSGTAVRGPLATLKSAIERATNIKIPELVPAGDLPPRMPQPAPGAESPPSAAPVPSPAPSASASGGLSPETARVQRDLHYLGWNFAFTVGLFMDLRDAAHKAAEALSKVEVANVLQLAKTMWDDAEELFPSGDEEEPLPACLGANAHPAFYQYWLRIMI